jgi:hypothetical protein
MLGKHFGGEQQRLRKEHYFNVPNIILTFVEEEHYGLTYQKNWVESTFPVNKLPLLPSPSFL